MLERVWRDILPRTPVTAQEYDIALEEELDRNVASMKEYKAVLYVNGERMELGLPLVGGRFTNYF